MKTLPVLTSDAVLPPLYEKWTREFLRQPLSTETAASCEDCAMCAEHADSTCSAASFFSPRIKCCSYVPELPSFLVGGALASSDPTSSTGRHSLRERIERRVAVTPLGLGRSELDDATYDHVTRRGGFGRSETVRCPHYVDEAGGRCGVWQHRNSVCSTFFCKHDRGAAGSRLWAAVRDLLQIVERGLSWWCALELGLDERTLERLLALRTGESSAARSPERPDDESYRALWGEWAGREEDYFHACAELVNDLSWTDVANTCGVQTRVAARVASSAQERMGDEALPTRLRVGSLRNVLPRGGSWRIESYSSFDPVDLPAALFEVLHVFDGRRTEAAIASAEDLLDMRIDPRLVRRLVDFEILVDAGTAPDSTTTRP